jgi:hypothetical protein
MADTCGAKTRSGGKCQKAPLAGKKRCRLHGGLSTGNPSAAGNSSAMKHGFYSDALQPEERSLWERVEIGTIDDEIRLMKIKLHRMVRLSGSQDVADLIDSALEVTQKQGEVFDHKLKKHVPYSKLEITAAAPQYAELIIKALDMIRKLELARAQLKAAGGSGGGDGDDMDRDDTVILRPDEPIPEKPVV